MYTYKETVGGDYSWIEKLEHINPVTSANPNFVDIHFTKPKVALVSTLTHPHVTFELHSGKKYHWYVENKNGKWTIRGPAKAWEKDAQKKIAEQVLADAEALNWIRGVPPKDVVSDDGFTLVESASQKKKRLQTSF